MGERLLLYAGRRAPDGIIASSRMWKPGLEATPRRGRKDRPRRCPRRRETGDARAGVMARDTSEASGSLPLAPVVTIIC
jgi:hypothetical protein